MFIHPLKIIWNITNRCGYDCKICATYSDREELDLDNKNKVLKSILSIGIQNIVELDFAGGDPLFTYDSIQIIHNSINTLGREKVSVTTTGKGIDFAVEMGVDLAQLLYNCEITIDCPNYMRNDTSYITTNQEAIRRIDKNIVNLTINVPILNPEMDNDSIKMLVNAIAGINVRNISVNLIRLMSVGRIDLQQNSNLYSPEHFVQTFIKYAENTCIKNIYIHCALRGKITGAQCNMLRDKIGIDCSGNVFACAWGGYVGGYDKYNISESPFYMGNLLKKPLAEILTDKHTTQLKQLISENPTTHCRVYCYRKNDNMSIFMDTDPLFR